MYRMEQANAERGGEKHVFESAAAPAGTAVVWPVALRGCLRAGAGARYFHRGCFSGGGADVSGRISSHLLRHRLPAQILTSVEKGMNIGREKHENCRLEVTQGPLVAAAARIWRQGGSITRVHSA